MPRIPNKLTEISRRDTWKHARFVLTEPRHEKPVFGVFDLVTHKPACAVTEASYKLEISDIETRDIILSRQRTTKALIRLRGCAGWSAPLLFAYGKNRFSHDVFQLFEVILFVLVIIIINNGSVLWCIFFLFSFFRSFLKDIVNVERGNYDSLNRKDEERIKKVVKDFYI